MRLALRCAGRSGAPGSFAANCRMGAAVCCTGADSSSARLPRARIVRRVSRREGCGGAVCAQAAVGGGGHLHRRLCPLHAGGADSGAGRVAGSRAGPVKAVPLAGSRRAAAAAAVACHRRTVPHGSQQLLPVWLPECRVPLTAPASTLAPPLLCALAAGRVVPRRAWGAGGPPRAALHGVWRRQPHAAQPHALAD